MMMQTSLPGHTRTGTKSAFPTFQPSGRNQAKHELEMAVRDYALINGYDLAAWGASEDGSIMVEIDFTTSTTKFTEVQ